MGGSIGLVSAQTKVCAYLIQKLFVSVTLTLVSCLPPSSSLSSLLVSSRCSSFSGASTPVSSSSSCSRMSTTSQTPGENSWSNLYHNSRSSFRSTLSSRRTCFSRTEPRPVLPFTSSSSSSSSSSRSSSWYSRGSSWWAAYCQLVFINLDYIILFRAALGD